VISVFRLARVPSEMTKRLRSFSPNCLLLATVFFFVPPSGHSGYLRALWTLFSRLTQWMHCKSLGFFPSPLSSFRACARHPLLNMGPHLFFQISEFYRQNCRRSRRFTVRNRNPGSRDRDSKTRYSPPRLENGETPL